MANLPGKTPFADEALNKLLVPPRYFGVEHFQSKNSIKDAVADQIDRSHPAVSQLFFNDVFFKLVPWGQ